MGDIALKKTQDGFNFDLAIMGNDLATDEGLQTAVLLSVFTDRFVTKEKLPAGETDQGGWWGDDYLPVVGDKIGSEFWTLVREKRSPETLSLAEEIVEASLQWMIDDGVSQSVRAAAEYTTEGYLAISVQIKKPDGTDVNFVFSDQWNAELATTE